MVLKNLAAAVALLLALALAIWGFVYSGLYNVAADEPHWAVTERAFSLLRTRSIEARASGVTAPNLADAKRILEGARQYAEMCAACHLAPGVPDTALRQGLYPRPPELARHRMDPRISFWIIKHGIKMTGMPAWGASHDDEVLWSIVAFLQKLPELDAKQYRELVGTAPAHEEVKGSHDAHSGMPAR